MELERLQVLLEQAGHIMPAEREKSIFSAAGRGYFENPTTDLLAFFLDPRQGHDLGDCFLRGLLNCLPETEDLSFSLKEPPQREVRTHAGNRIDLVLVGDNWTLVLENKIFHSQINPFDDYEAYASSTFPGEGHQLLYAVLSPVGACVKSNWSGISYSRLIDQVRLQLGQWLITKSLDKWQVFARDFLLHLESITVEQNMDKSTVDFVLGHLHEINKLSNLKDQVINALDSKVVSKLESEIPGYERYTRRHTWKDGPALRYASNNWVTWSDVVLYLDASNDILKPSIRVYLCEVDEELVEQGSELFNGNQCKSWREGKDNSVLAFEWGLDHFDEQKVLQMIADKMGLLMEFETRKRVVLVEG